MQQRDYAVQSVRRHVAFGMDVALGGPHVIVQQHHHHHHHCQSLCRGRRMNQQRQTKARHGGFSRRKNGQKGQNRDSLGLALTMMLDSADCRYLSQLKRKEQAVMAFIHSFINFAIGDSVGGGGVELGITKPPFLLLVCHCSIHPSHIPLSSSSPSSSSSPLTQSRLPRLQPRGPFLEIELPLLEEGLDLVESVLLLLESGCFAGEFCVEGLEVGDDGLEVRC